MKCFISRSVHESIKHTEALLPPALKPNQTIILTSQEEHSSSFLLCDVTSGLPRPLAALLKLRRTLYLVSRRI